MGMVLADFSFSRFGAMDDLVNLARSEPWDAPEWHPREFKLKDAKKMDVYSSGLVCLWLFFGNNTLLNLGLPSTTIKTAFMGGSLDAIALGHTRARGGEQPRIVSWFQIRAIYGLGSHRYRFCPASSPSFVPYQRKPP